MAKGFIIYLVTWYTVVVVEGVWCGIAVSSIQEMWKRYTGIHIDGQMKVCKASSDVWWWWWWMEGS